MIAELLGAKIAGADKVELKITVTGEDEERAYESLDISERIAVRRAIYFFDTPELTLNQAGVVLRARDIENANHDSVVKIRPVEPEKVDGKWRVTDGFKIEAEVISAFELTAEQISELVNTLKKKLGCDVTLTTTIDESLIGGVVIKAGDTIIDASMKSQLDSLALSLGR